MLVVCKTHPSRDEFRKRIFLFVEAQAKYLPKTFVANDKL